mmetsp:Transcript_10429/g.22304  ORF Transcript_10429/g.22304 Transcript_10429/m.22304 type:complete len:189 (-) Transcript_10429:170-736(-)
MKKSISKSSSNKDVVSKKPTKAFKWHFKYHKLFMIPTRRQRPQKPLLLSASELEESFCSEGFCLAPFQNHQNNELLAALARPPPPYQTWSEYLAEFSMRRWGFDGWEFGFQFYLGHGFRGCGCQTPVCKRCCDIAEWIRRQHFACGECRSCIMQQRRVHKYHASLLPFPVFVGPHPQHGPGNHAIGRM